MNDTNSNLVTFKARDNGDVVKIKERSKCQHYSFEVDMESCEVQCVQCKDFLDPVFVLLRLTEIYSDRDYKYAKIEEFEAKEVERRTKDLARRLARNRKAQQQRLATALNAPERETETLEGEVAGSGFHSPDDF